MDDESGELMELVEEVPLKELGDAKVVDEEKPEVGSRDEGKSAPSLAPQINCFINNVSE